MADRAVPVLARRPVARPPTDLSHESPPRPASRASPAPPRPASRASIRPDPPRRVLAMLWIAVAVSWYTVVTALNCPVQETDRPAPAAG